jgi:hypothetical protein
LHGGTEISYLSNRNFFQILLQNFSSFFENVYSSIFFIIKNAILGLESISCSEADSTGLVFMEDGGDTAARFFSGATVASSRPEQTGQVLMEDGAGTAARFFSGATVASSRPENYYAPSFTAGNSCDFTSSFNLS